MVDAIAARRALADPLVAIDYGLHMTIGPGEIALLDQLPEAVDAGCLSFKLYMAYGLRLTDDQLMLALEAVRDVNGLPVIHTENWDIITALVARNLAAGRTEPCWHPRSRPALMEGEAAGRAIDIAELTGSRLHIFHVSCQEVVRRVEAARHRGLVVTAETCPQYLLLTDEIFDRPGLAGALPVCSPPIRDQSAQDALWKALGQGQLQVVTTDHCPFTAAEKATGLGDYSRIPGGVPSIEARFPALYTFGVRAGHVSLEQWVDLCCTAPARLVGLKGKGDIQVGYDADLVVFDPDKPFSLSVDTLHEQVDWTPYEGLALQGWPSIIISRGEIIVSDGDFHGRPGRGRYARRTFV
jgi:dihydropyrimidinase